MLNLEMGITCVDACVQGMIERHQPSASDETMVIWLEGRHGVLDISSRLVDEVTQHCPWDKFVARKMPSSKCCSNDGHATISRHELLDVSTLISESGVPGRTYLH